MGGEWLWTPKPSFVAEWRALPRKDEHLVFEKIKLLEQDPTPDGKTKIHLRYKEPKNRDKELYRLRCGDYREPGLKAPVIHPGMKSPVHAWGGGDDQLGADPSWPCAKALVHPPHFHLLPVQKE